MADPVGALRVELSATSAQFEADIARARGAMRRMQSGVDELAGRMRAQEKATAGVTGRLKAFADETLKGGVKNLGATSAALGKVTQQLSGLSGVAGSAAGAVANLVASGLTPMTLAISAAVTGLVAWHRATDRVRESTEDLRKTQAAFVADGRVFQARMDDLRNGTQTAGLVRLQGDLERAQAEYEAAKGALVMRPEGFTGVTTGFSDAYAGGYEVKIDAVEKARLKVLGIEREIGLELERQNIERKKEAESASAAAQDASAGRSGDTLSGLLSRLDTLSASLSQDLIVARSDDPDAARARVARSALEQELYSSLDGLGEDLQGPLAERIEQVVALRDEVERLTSARQRDAAAAEEYARILANGEEARVAEAEAVAAQVDALNEFVSGVEAKAAMEALVGFERQLAEMENDRIETFERAAALGATIDERNRLAAVFDARRERLYAAQKEAAEADAAAARLRIEEEEKRQAREADAQAREGDFGAGMKRGASEMKTLEQHGYETALGIKAAFADALTDFINDAKTAKEALADLARAIQQMLVRRAVEYAVDAGISALGSLGGGAGGGGSAGAGDAAGAAPVASAYSLSDPAFLTPEAAPASASRSWGGGDAHFTFHVRPPAVQVYADEVAAATTPRGASALTTKLRTAFSDARGRAPQ